MIRTIRALAVGFALSCISIVGQTQIDHDYSAAASPNPVPTELRVDLNHATLGELLTVPGMTSSWAKRILRFRPYRTKQDLLDEGIVPGAVYNRIRNYLIAHKERPV